MVRNDLTQGVERGTYGTLGRRTRRKAGLPIGREAQGSGAAIVVPGVTTGDGARESRAQGGEPVTRTNGDRAHLVHAVLPRYAKVTMRRVASSFVARIP